MKITNLTCYNFKANASTPTFTKEQKSEIICNRFDWFIRPDDEEFLLNDERAFSQFYQIKDYNMGRHSIIAYAKLTDEEFKKAQELIQIGMVPAHAHKAAKLEGEQYERIKYLTQKKIAFEDAKEIALLNKNGYERAIKLLKTKMPIFRVIKVAQLDENSYSLVREGLKKGIDYLDGINYLTQTVETSQDAATYISRAHRGYDFYHAENGTDSADKYIKMGYSPQASIILEKLSIWLEHERQLSQSEMDSVNRIESFIRKNSIKTRKYIKELSDFISEKTRNSELEDFDKYINTIDIKKIKRLAPHMVRYTSTELLSFLNWHYANNTKEFNQETLDMDLTKYLQNHPTDKNQLWHLLNAHPLTRREVGEIPQEWLDKVKDKDKETITKEIYSSIKKFQGKKDTQELSQSLEKILNRKVKVEKLGEGLAGIVYKVNVEDNPPVCLKLFHIYRRSNFTPPNIHGVNYEPQIGVFLSKNTDNFVHMYFGKVAAGDNKDGFIVTQFLDNHTHPITSYRNNRYYIRHNDDKEGNKIKGTYIDYGGATVSIQ